MKKSALLTVELSEKRERVNVLLALAELSSEQRTELDATTKRLLELEPELRAAIVSEDALEGDIRRQFNGAEDRELRDLAARANMGEIMIAAIDRRQTNGPEAEIQAHFKVGANEIPLEMFRGIEHRAITPAPANVQANQDTIIPAVFPASVAEFLGIYRPTVPKGDAAYPVLTNDSAVRGPFSASDVAAETTGSFTANLLGPERLQASFFYRRTDAARFVGMDEALRMNLSDALADSMDNQILAGTKGLLAGSVLAANAAAAATTAALYESSLLFGRVDGRFAENAMAVRQVVGSATYAHAATQYRANANDDSALDTLMESGGGVRVSAHVPGVASHKQNALIRLGMRRDYVAPMWEGITLIPDEITGATKGEITITAILQANFQLLRSGGFYKQETQHA